MKTLIIGAGSDLGVHIDGAHIGPVQLINDLQSFYKGEKISFIQDESILKSRNLSDRRKNEYDIDKFNTSVYKAIVENYKEECFPILLGGDHSVAVASALASAKKYTDIGIIWVDAHGDYNTFDTTITGNIHGLPLAAITGYKNHELRYFHDGNTINPQNAVIVGARSLDEAEKENLKYYDPDLFDEAIIREREEISEQIKALNELGYNVATDEFYEEYIYYSCSNMQKNVLTSYNTLNRNIDFAKYVITDKDGNAISWSSAGRIGYKGSKKKTPFCCLV